LRSIATTWRSSAPRWQILDEHPDESLRPKMEEAVRRCPKQALSIQED
jgi:ferredoxin